MKPALQRLFSFFPRSLFFFFLTSPAGRRACPVCVKLVSLNANAMSLGGNFVVLHKGTSKSYHKSVHREIPGELGLGVWLHTHTQEKLCCSCGFAHAKWHIRCLTAWESVNIKPHNQWGPFKVLEMASDKCHFLSMSRLPVCCFQGRWHEEEFNWITLKNLTETFSWFLFVSVTGPRSHTCTGAKETWPKEGCRAIDQIHSTCAFAYFHWRQKKVLVMTQAADEMDFPLFGPDMTTRRMNKSKRSE